ncbi:hypothetical protein [Mycobacterium sp. E1715]|uniref:hypothetical protein n=1 Tax=Mycobacterium sp. E1715 TaxID=1856863 RepID=UPI001E2A1E69|nr:hypothetical protein [Mycobacterium sp. E1715]
MPEPVIGQRREELLNLVLGVGVDHLVWPVDAIDMLGDVAGHQATTLRVGQHLGDGLNDLVRRVGSPRAPGPTLRRLGAAGEQIGYQLVDMTLGEPLHRQVPVPLPQGRQVVGHLGARAGPQIVAASKPLLADLLDGGRFAGDELASDRLVTDCGESAAGCSLGVVAAANLLTLAGRRVHTAICPKLVSHNRFPSFAVGCRDFRYLRR